MAVLVRPVQSRTRRLQVAVTLRGAGGPGRVVCSIAVCVPTAQALETVPPRVQNRPHTPEISECPSLCVLIGVTSLNVTSLCS